MYMKRQILEAIIDASLFGTASGEKDDTEKVKKEKKEKKE